MASEREKALGVAIAQIEKSFGKGSIMKLGEGARLAVECIATGAISLDLALGVGGLPRGRIVEIYGPEGCGKTTVSLQVIAEAQRRGGVVAFIDAEHALDPTYAKALGVDLDNLFISQPDFGEQGLEIAETLARSGAVDVLVIDSVAALVPKAEVEGDMGDQHMGLQARLMSQALRKLTAVVSKSKTILIFINQLREKIGVMFGNPEVTPGGRALKFYCSIRLEVRPVEKIKNADNQIVATRIKVKVVKNKVAPPFRETQLVLVHGRGIDRDIDILETATRLGVVQRSGAWYLWGEERLGNGIDNSKQYLKEHPDVSLKLTDAIIKVVDAAQDAAKRSETGSGDVPESTSEKSVPKELVGAGRKK